MKTLQRLICAKKCILSAIAGALAMLLILYGIAAFRAVQKPEEYKHIDYVSDLPQEDCYICGNGSDGPYWGEDNVGLLNLNTFELMHIEINRYDGYGDVIEEPAGYMQTDHLIGNDTYAHAYIFPDNGYAQVQITGVEYSIDREIIQSHLCQDCLNTINSLWFSGNAPAEYAIISFEDRKVQPLLQSRPWFSAGAYDINCELKGSGEIDLSIQHLEYGK